MHHCLNIILGLDSLLEPHTLPESDKPFDLGLVKVVELGRGPVGVCNIRDVQMLFALRSHENT